VGWPQVVSGIALIALLAAMAGYYAWRQRVAFADLRDKPDLPDAERRYRLGQAYRRLVGCVLLGFLAALLLGALIWLEAPAQRLADERDAQPDDQPMSPEQRFFARIYGWYWLVFLMLLLAVVVLAAWDTFATRRYALREHRKLADDRRAMLARQVNRLRQERNGHG
jgi:hypothetical protein